MQLNDVNPAMVITARESRGMLQRDLASNSGISQSKVSKIENGILRTSHDDLQRIAAATEFHPSFFLCKDPIYGLGSSLIFNRKQKTTPVSQQRMVQARVNIARIQVERLLLAAELDTVHTIERIDIDDCDGDPRAVARRVRAALRLPMGPVRDITQAIESAGGLVVMCNFGSRRIDGAHIWLPGHPPFFFMNAERPGDRHRFNLAHELGHAVMHECPVGDIEKQANEFAAEFLMPSNEIRPQLRNLTLERAARLKQRWRVSMSALIYNAHTLGCISDSRRSSLYAGLRTMLDNYQEPIIIRREEPILLRQLMELHRQSLGYTDADFRSLFMMDEADYIEFPEGVGPGLRPLTLDPSPLRISDYQKRASGE
jgi:Zn-dependent peptidase ImmA (M78 family)/DNA-binding XRE family transcriptional regulator